MLPTVVAWSTNHWDAGELPSVVLILLISSFDIDIHCCLCLILYCWVCFCSVFLSSYIEVSLIPQLVKNPPTMQETLVRFLGREEPLEKG